MAQFNIDEVFEMARQIERNGVKFYAKAARQVGNEAVRKLLQNLSEWEQRHEQIFAGMQEDLPEAQRRRMYDPQDEAHQYLRAFVDGRVFDRDADPSQRITGSESFSELLDMAVAIEKDSIVFYAGVKPLLGTGADRIEQIIREELKHIRILTTDLPQAAPRASES